MLNVLEVLQKTTDYFASKGIESPRLQAELLVGHALGLKRMQLYLQFERVLTDRDLDNIRPLVRRRAGREPLQYILGSVEWAGLTLKVDKRVLIPRPETEYLWELLTNRLAATPPQRLLDLGTGSGALALALAKHFPSAEVWAVDLSAAALALAQENAAANALTERVQWRQSDWLTALPREAPFDLIVANPPYLSATEVAAAEPEVRSFEPASALVAEEAGLAALRKILAEAADFLTPGGWLALETGIAHHAQLTAQAVSAGWTEVSSLKDLTGRDRFFFARKAL